MDGTFHERILPARLASPGAPPLLVMLHGIGADERDLLPLARFLDPRLVVASLRAPHGYGVGYSWFPIAFRRDGTLNQLTCSSTRMRNGGLVRHTSLLRIRRRGSRHHLA